MKFQKRIKNTAQNLLLLFLTLFLLIGIFEIFLRAYNPFEFRVKGDKIILPANKTYRINNTKIKKVDKTVIHTKNSLGFRGEEAPEDFEKHLTIITIGGSTTECFYASDGKTWTDVLGKKLKNHFKDLWINNAGLDGQTTFGHIILMEDYIIKLRPKIVLFLVGANDYGGGIGILGYGDRGMLKTESTLEYNREFLKPILNNSEVFLLALNIYRNFKARKKGMLHKGFDFGKMPVIEIPEKVRKNIMQKVNNLDQKPFEDRLKYLVKISRANNMEPVFVTQPVIFGKAIDDVTKLNLAKASLGKVYFDLPTDGEIRWENLERTNDVTRRVGREENILVIDLSKELPKSSRYYYDSFHFSNDGNEKVAEIIYEKLCPFLDLKYNKFLIRACKGKLIKNIFIY